MRKLLAPTISALFSVAATAAFACEGMTTLEFYQTATADDVAACIAQGQSMAPDETGITPLLAAAASAPPGIVQLLVDAGGDLSFSTPDGFSPLVAAAVLNPDHSVTTLLLNAGAEFDLQARDPDLVRELIAMGANSIFLMHVVEQGFDVLTRSEHGSTLLHDTASSASPDLIDFLLSRGIDPNARRSNGSTALHLVAGLNPDPAATERLLAAGSDLSAREERGFTALHLAAWHNSNPEVTRLLLEHGADPNARSLQGATPLHIAVSLNESSTVTVALLEAGANTEARDQTGNTALHRAMGRFIDEAPQIVEALIAAGADVRARNGQGQLAIDMIADNSPLQGTDAYWQVNEGRFD